MQSYGQNWRAPRVNVKDFAMSPKAEIPRSTIRMQHTHKTTLQAGLLTPIYLREILPGDSFKVDMTMFARLATPIYPIMDNVDIETFFFFVPNRLVWIHWYKFMGEQDNPGDSINYTIPYIQSPVGGFAQNSVYDYFGVPVNGQTGVGNTTKISALPLRAYTLIWNQWFRDENILNSQAVGSGALTQVGSTAGYGYVSMDDGPDASTLYSLYSAAKRRDYFTSCLPWPQKGGIAVPIISGNVPVGTNASNSFTGVQNSLAWLTAAGTAPAANTLGIGGGSGTFASSTASVQTTSVYPSNLTANLSTYAFNTINALRFNFQYQRQLERDARGGTRYTEIVKNHFGVDSPDQRLMRPEILATSKAPINIAPVPQTTATGLTGGASPLGTLSGVGLSHGRHGFRQSFTEHGHVIGLVVVRREQQYQQGLDKLWTRSTKSDFYLPVYAELGEQAVTNAEIYSDGSGNDALTFGYQERWGEYRWARSYTSAYFRSTNTTPLDSWHLATKFSSVPTLLSAGWVADDTNTVLQRALAGGAADNYQQVLCDFFFNEVAARPMPVYSVPGHADHL